jgi:hypothetical protein
MEENFTMSHARLLRHPGKKNVEKSKHPIGQKNDEQLKFWHTSVK